MIDREAIWQELLTAALVGTDRHLPALPAADGVLAGLLARLDATHVQHRLLEGAAVVALYRQSGRLPKNVPASDFPRSEPDDQPRCSSTAAARLAAMLGGEHPELIPEWLSLAAAAQKRVSEELLPELLAWGEEKLDRFEFVFPVLGQRGRWLARQIPWADDVAEAVMVAEIQPEACENLWQTGSRHARRLILHRLRLSDPVWGLKLLASTWSVEDSEDRATFIEILESGLSMADEPFLEAALDDHAKQVRKAAANLLTRLPESRLGQRQLERVQACLKWRPGGFLRKAQIEVTLPEACDKGMVRDGVEPSRSVTQLGGKTDWLLQILSAIPPVIWSKAWGKSPSDLLEIAADGDWKDLLVEGWMIAAGRYPDADWVEAILRLYPGRLLLLQGLPAPRRQAFLVSQLQSQLKEGIDLLEGYQSSWGKELTQLSLPYLREYYLQENDAAHLAHLQPTFVALGHFMDPSLAAGAARVLLDHVEPGSAWEKAVAGLLQVLDFRHQMAEELR